tara:strand:+ start:227 stop:478 length:252 start_codon:yes stop_codon:yes gene_type:complete
MLKDYLEQRHITLASGRSSIGLEREYWKALEILAYEDEKFELRELQTNQLKAKRTPQVQVPQDRYRQINEIDEHEMLCVIKFN